MFTDLLLIPDHTCPGSLLRSKISYCLRHSHLVCTSSNYTIKTEFVKSQKSHGRLLLPVVKWNCLKLQAKKRIVIMQDQNKTPIYLETNGDFRMRELDKGDLDQFNALLQYAFQVTTKELFETGWAQDEIKYAKRPILEEAYVIGWFYKDRLASMIVVYHMQVNVHDNIMDMGGITGVATYPEYAGRGLIHSLMRRVLDYMNKQQMPLSFLCPYSIPFYRKMGWEICSDQLTFNVKDVQLPKARPVPGMVERVSLDSEDYHNVHSYFAFQQHGCMIRDTLSWEEYWRWDNDDMIVAVYYSREHKPLGYVAYYIANEIFHIKEI